MFPLPVQTQNLTVITQPAESSIRGLSFKDDGSKMYVSGTDNQSMFVIGLGTKWDLDTLTFIGVLNVASASGDSTPLDTFTNFTDTRFLIGGSILRKYLHTLPTLLQLLLQRLVSAQEQKL